MSSVIVSFDNEEAKAQALNALKQLKGVSVQDSHQDLEQADEQEWTDEFIDANWKQILMDTPSAILDDKEAVRQACWEFYNEKHNN